MFWVLILIDFEDKNEKVDRDKLKVDRDKSCKSNTDVQFASKNTETSLFSESSMQLQHVHRMNLKNENLPSVILLLNFDALSDNFNCCDI